jgi:fructose-bisphosphate aldolase, class II
LPKTDFPQIHFGNQKNTDCEGSKMALMNTKEMLKKATEEKFSLCAFNVDTLDYVRAVIQAAEEERAPIIVETVEQAIEEMGLKYFTKLVRQMGEDASIPVGLHLDHGSSLEWIKACLDAGFTSVMIDASSKPLKENIRITQQVVKMAENYGVFTEGEIGHVPGIEEGIERQTTDLVYTNPSEAVEYCKESGVESLAVSIGTVHYMRKIPLELDFDLLGKIREVVKVPLVLHGGAAVIDQDMRRVVEHGIAKYNIAYKGYKAYLGGIEEDLKNLNEEIVPGRLFVFPSKVIKAGVEAAKKEIRSKIKLLGASGKAG